MAVEVVESLVVPPSEEIPRHGLWLSGLDLVHAKRGHTPTVYLYRRDSQSGADDDFFDIDRLKASLGKALVAFYPVAGRLSTDGDGRPEIDCAGQGVHLVVARSPDLTVDDLSDYQPSPKVKSLFVPGIIDECPEVMCAVQVTFLKCGGVALGTALHHAVIDGVSAFNFFKTWAAFSRCRDGDMDVELEPPCHERTLLRARSPLVPFVHPDAALTGPSSGPMKGPFLQEIFSISKDQVAALKRACSGGASGGVISTFCAVSTHVWRCMCIARRLALDATTELTFPANFRRSLSPPLPDAYFGNAVVRTSASARVGDLLSAANGLGFGARRVRAATAQGDAYARSVVDHLEKADMAARGGGLAGTDLRVVSWMGMPSHDADFGWGEPALLAPALMYYAGFVYLISCPGKAGDVAVAVALEPDCMAQFKEIFFEGMAAAME